MNSLEYNLSKILLPPLQKLDSDLQSLIAKHRIIAERIKTAGIAPHSIVSLGCGNGGETLALAHILGAKEVIGVDKDESLVGQANHTVVDEMLKPIQQSIDRIWSSLPSPPADLEISDAIRSTLEQLLYKYAIPQKSPR